MTDRYALQKVNIFNNKWVDCPECGIKYLDTTKWRPLTYIGSHTEVCEYIKFRDKTAPHIGWVELPQRPYEEINLLRATLDSIDIPWKSFSINSVSMRELMLFVPSNVADLVKIYNNKDSGSYAGLDLADFLRAAITE